MSTLLTFLTRLKQRLEAASPSVPIALLFPPPALCTGMCLHLFSVANITEYLGYEDNAAMIAWASMHRFLNNDHDEYTIELRSKWSIEELSA